MRDSPVRIRPPRTRTPKMAGFEVRKLWSGGDPRMLAFVREAFEGADRVRLHEDAVLLRFDVDLRLLRDLLDDRLEVAFRGPKGGSGHGPLEAAAQDLDARGGRHARHRVESF